MTNIFLRSRPIVLLCGLALLSGCESPGWMHTLRESFSMSADAGYKAEEANRREFQATGSRKALVWLLANRIDTGMSYGDVCQVLGQDGEREYVDRWLKEKGSTFRLDDAIYRFGPDDEGHSYYLAFRDGHLVNYDRDHFRSMSGPPRSGAASKKSSAHLLDELP
jgi:hypothetical protein